MADGRQARGRLSVRWWCSSAADSGGNQEREIEVRAGQRTKDGNDEWKQGFQRGRMNQREQDAVRKVESRKGSKGRDYESTTTGRQEYES